jgi:hypothetical protein
VLAQHLGDPPQHFGAFERQHVPPFLEGGLRAATAASTSAAPASATRPSDSPVPGLIVSASRPDLGACQAPP